MWTAGVPPTVTGGGWSGEWYDNSSSRNSAADRCQMTGHRWALGAEGMTAQVLAPSVDASLGMKLLPTVLSMTAGSVDVISFLWLGGLFTAHITGNLVILASRIVSDGEAPVAPMLSVLASTARRPISSAAWSASTRARASALRLSALGSCAVRDRLAHLYCLAPPPN